MNTKPLHQVVLLAAAAALLAGCTGSLPSTSVIVTQPPVPTAPASTSTGATTAPSTAAPTSPATTVTVTGPGSTTTVTKIARSTVTVATDFRMADTTSYFVSPSGRIACLMVHPDDVPNPALWVRCDYMDTDRGWTLPKPARCELSWGASLVLLDTAKAGCGSPAIYEGAIMHPMFQGYQTWWHMGDPTVQKYGSTMAALPYGSALQVGMARCAMETSGVTCTNLVTGHGIVVSQSTYGMF